LAFKDHFSRQAHEYTRYRPRYPRALFESLAALAFQRSCAWDCGTGNGQAAVALADDFSQVVATDPSARQIAHAEPHPRVRYLVAAAEHCPLEDHSVDLITVAQALHWFELEAFYAEVRRVGRPGGAVAAWCYGLAAISPAVDRVVWRLYHDIVGAYWPPERRMIETRYASVPFPFDPLPVSEFVMSARWNLDDLVGYLGTWSSVQKYLETNAADPLELVRAELAAAWGPAGEVREVTWRLFVRAGRIE
jgi:SAM-dependent methyltransferase